MFSLIDQDGAISFVRTREYLIHRTSTRYEYTISTRRAGHWHSRMYRQCSNLMAVQLQYVVVY